MAKKAKGRGAAKARKAVPRKPATKRSARPPARAAKRAAAPREDALHQMRPTGAGIFCWNELMTSDVAGAKAFYGGLFGWGSQDMEMPDLTYTLLLRGADQAGGLMKHPMSGAPAWLSYVCVDDADACARKVAALGGTVVVPPQDIPNIGRFLVAVDPQGASFAMIQPKTP